jgi:HPt (histidine-containing phosphotransfer) domain-containing protein
MGTTTGGIFCASTTRGITSLCTLERMEDKAVDVSGLLALREMRRPGTADGVRRIVERFLEESDERLAVMRNAVTMHDATSLERAAHALRGITGTVGANEMQKIAVRIEQIGREGHTSGAGALVEELGHAYGRARPIFEGLRTPN